MKENSEKYWSVIRSGTRLYPANQGVLSNFARNEVPGQTALRLGQPEKTTA